MPAIVVPKSNISLGAGYLYRALVGSALPGTLWTVTNKSLTTNVATLTTSATHTLQIGDSITVALSPADPVFDGTYTITAVTSTTVSYAKTNANVTGTATAGTITGPFTRAGGIVAGGVFTDAWPTAWVPWGVTREGHELSYKIDTGNVEAAEYLIPLRIVTEGVEAGVAFEVMEMTSKNLSFALNNGGTVVTTGSGATSLTRTGPPVAGADVRVMLGWESEDFTERWIAYQCLQTGEVKIPRKKGADNAGLTVDYGIEQSASFTDPFNHWAAGTTRIGS